MTKLKGFLLALALLLVLVPSALFLASCGCTPVPPEPEPFSIIGDWKTEALVIREETIPAGEGSDFAEDFLVLSFDDAKVLISMNQQDEGESNYIYDEENDIYSFEFNIPDNQGRLKFEISVLESESEDEKLEVTLYMYNPESEEWEANPIFDSVIMIRDKAD